MIGASEPASVRELPVTFDCEGSTLVGVVRELGDSV